MSLRILKRKPLLFTLYAVGLVLLATAGWLWWSKLNANPERVFWGMIEQSLATSGVTVQSSQTGQNSDMHQTVQYSLGGQNLAHSWTALNQGNTHVVNEMIGTPTTDYVRYVSIKTDQKGKDGKPLDVASVTGMWAKRDTSPQLFAQNVLGTGLPFGGVAVPIADLSPELRAKMVKQIKEQGVYSISFKKEDVKRERKDGRLLYTYTAKVQPVMYATMMKMLAKDVGLHQLDQFDPSTFASQQAYTIRLIVDVHARELVAAEAVTAPIRQTYSAYNIPVSTPVPSKTISLTELQERLSKLQ